MSFGFYSKSVKKSFPFFSLICWILAGIATLLLGISFFHGFPLLEGTFVKAKSSRKFFEWAFGLFLAGMLIYPNRKDLFISLREKLLNFANSRFAIWILAGVYFLLFLWQQVSKYLALDVNFIPFLFYDYMLWYFDHGRFCYTGFLHGYYHINLILLLLYPVWKIFQNSWVLLVAQPLIGAVAVIPFYLWSRKKLKSVGWALLAGFVYLNFRYLQNVLLVNFAVEIFYPLFIFSSVYFADRKNETFYYLSLFLGLLIKEDSVIYFGALGAFFLFCRGQRLRGFLTVLLSLAYIVWVIKVFIPWSVVPELGSSILKGSLGNYRDLGSTPSGVVGNILKNPLIFIHQLFFPWEKTVTLLKLISKLLFLPLFSPWLILVLAAVYPLFFRSEQGELFTSLALYYSAAVLPFLFLAFVDGWRRIMSWKFISHKPFLRWGVAGVLIFLNGMNFRPNHFDQDDLKTITLAKSIPAEKIVVTQGHLLPYLGYRKSNFYWASPFGKNPKTKEAYLNPDYYFFDLEANAYPYSPEELRNHAVELKKDSHFAVRHEDHRRLLLERAP